MEKLNERLIGKVIEHIKAFPKTYNQNIVARSCDITKKTPCGALACFGGWTVLLGVPKKNRQQAAENEAVDLDEAKDLLHLTEDEADYLFDMANGGSPSKNLKIIQERLKVIRGFRALLEPLLEQDLNRMDVSFVTPTGQYLNYEE